jgi:hypothetical protein
LRNLAIHMFLKESTKTLINFHELSHPHDRLMATVLSDHGIFLKHFIHHPTQISFFINNRKDIINAYQSLA